MSTSNENSAIEPHSCIGWSISLKLGLLLSVVVVNEIGFHAFMASQTMVGRWLLSVYAYREVPSGKGWGYILDWAMPAVVLGLPTGVWGYQWSASRMACVCSVLTGAMGLLVWIDNYLLPTRALWWLPRAPGAQLEFYLIWNLFPIALILFLLGFCGRRFERERPEDSSWPRGSLRRMRRL